MTETKAVEEKKEDIALEDKKRNFKLDFNKFFKNTPCVRSSLLTGITGGLVAGMTLFLYSKHVKRSCDLAVGSFAAISCSSWVYCSYNRRKQQDNINLVVESLKQKNKENREKIENYRNNREKEKGIKEKQLNRDDIL